MIRYIIPELDHFSYFNQRNIGKLTLASLYCQHVFKQQISAHNIDQTVKDFS